MSAKHNHKRITTSPLGSHYDDRLHRHLPHYLSLGAGVQSSTIALMAAASEITPMPAGAIFADTQAEPSEVYRWINWLERQLPFPVHRVTAGSLRDAVSTPHASAKGVIYHRTAIPFWTSGDGGDGKIPHRTCTRDFKIRPITKAVRRLARVKRGAKQPTLVQWIGISWDEWERLKVAREPWIATRWPLLDLRMTRLSCLDWMKARGYPRPPRSACTFCPFRNNAEWRYLRDTNPEEFADAVAFDQQTRDMRINSGTSSSSKVYIHHSRVPLGEADLRSDSDRGQLSLWQDECTGMCGV